METTFTYDQEATLSAPPGGILAAIMVTVEIEPADAGCLIYGFLADGSMGQVEVRGARTELELPFAEPKIYVKYLGGLKNLRILTRCWRDSGRQ